MENGRREGIMNIGVIFAGGTGTRMNSKDDKPKQFLEVHGKPIIVHTIEIFEGSKEIDAVIVVCLESWISYMEDLKYKYRLDKIKSIVPGGAVGQESIYRGLCETRRLYGMDEHIVLIHDGVRPLIDEEIIRRNIESVKKYGSAITSSVAKETFVLIDDNEEVCEIPSRAHSRIAKAPQSFWLKDILSVHEQALQDGIFNAIDSCTLMSMYHKKLSIVEGAYENIKITTPEDIAIAKILFDERKEKCSE